MVVLILVSVTKTVHAFNRACSAKRIVIVINFVTIFSKVAIANRLVVEERCVLALKTLESVQLNSVPALRLSA